MQSFLISSKSQDKALEEALEILSKKNIDKLDISIENFEKIAGISDIKNAIKNLYLKPLRGKHKALILNTFLGLTVEAQNTLLKTLEEPPESALIFLIISNINEILPTVVSRCKIINLKNAQENELNIGEIKNLVEKMGSQTPGFKLKIAQDFGGKREDTVLFLENAVIEARKLMLFNLETKESNFFAQMIKKLEEGRIAAKNTNVNQRFILENTLLAISR